MSSVAIPAALGDTLKSLGNSFLLLASGTGSLINGTEIRAYAETVPCWFLLNLKVVELK